MATRVAGLKPAATRSGNPFDLLAHIRPSQESGGDSQGKKARTGPSPTSEDEDAHADLRAQVKDAVDTALPFAIDHMFPSLVDRVCSAVAARLTSDIQRAVNFEIATLKEDMAKERKAHANEVQELKAALSAQRAQTGTQQAKLYTQVQVLERQVVVTGEAVDIQEKAARRNNIVIGNLREGVEGFSAKAHAADLLQVPQGTILEAKRLGAPRPQRARPRDMLVVFTDAANRASAFKQGASLRRKQVYLDIHLTPKQQATRWEKRARYTELRNKNCRPHWRGSDIWYYTASGRLQMDGRGPGFSSGRAPPARPAPTAPSSAPQAGSPPTPPAPPTCAPPPASMTGPPAASPAPASASAPIPHPFPPSVAPLMTF